ncbi:MAG TPA: sulfotransferase [Terriglobia bacterium]|nr:sulfotransferase [Terriglobia bacterium]
MANQAPEPTRASPDGAPFFVVGAMRSGTTLLRLMLASHPRLAIPPESHFLPELMEFETSSGGLDHKRERVIEWLIAHRRLADFNLGVEWMRRTMATLNPFTTRSIVSVLFAEYARREGKPRWGDKTPRYRCFIPQLHHVFPEAKFIHVLRDGRDTALSAWRARFGPKTWAAAVYDWRDSIRIAWTGQRSLPQEFLLEIRYEDLIQKPEDVLRKVCSFLQEDYHPEMLGFSGAAKKQVPDWEAAWHAKLEGPLDPKNTNKWKTELTPEQVLLFERIAGKELAAAGYLPANLSANTRIRVKASLMQSGYLLRTPLVRLLSFLNKKGPLERAA